MTLGRAVARTVVEARASIEDASTPLTSAGLLGALGGVSMDAGVPVSEVSSMAMPAVFRCVTVVSSVPASLPLHSYKSGSHERIPSKLLDDPHPEMTPVELWGLTYRHRALWGDSCTQKVRNRAGQVVELWPVRPERVHDIKRIASTEDNPGGKIFKIADDDGRVHTLTTRDILHIPHMSLDGVRGMSPIRAAAQGISLAQAAKRSAAKFFGRGAQLSGVLQTDRRLDEDDAKALKRRWRELNGGSENAGEVGILDSGAKFAPITMPFKDAQHLESRQFEVVEIARMFGVPLFLLMETTKSTSWGTGLEQQALGFVQFDLHPVWLAPTEQRVSKELLAPGEHAEYTVEGLLRGDSKARSEFYRTMRELGAFSANDIRSLERRPPVSGGDLYLQPLNMAPLGTMPAAAPADDDTGGDPTAAPVDEQQRLAERVNAAGVLIRSGFDAQASLRAVGLPSIEYLPVRPVTVQPIAAAEGGDVVEPTADNTKGDGDADDD